MKEVHDEATTRVRVEPQQRKSVHESVIHTYTEQHDVVLNSASSPTKALQEDSESEQKVESES
jgi:hypothetical protein